MNNIYTNYNLLKNILLYGVITFLLFASSPQAGICQDKIPAKQSGVSVNSSDSLNVAHQKLPSELTWEKTVNSPGRRR